MSKITFSIDEAHVGVLGRVPEIQKQGGLSIEGKVAPEQKEAADKAKEAIAAALKEVEVRAQIQITAAKNIGDPMGTIEKQSPIADKDAEKDVTHEAG